MTANKIGSSLLHASVYSRLHDKAINSNSSKNSHIKEGVVTDTTTDSLVNDLLSNFYVAGVLLWGKILI